MTDSTQEDRMPQDAVDEVVAEIDLDTQEEPAEAGTPKPAAGAELLVQEGDAAADYLEGLLDIADLDGDIDIDVEGDRALVSIVEASPGDLGHLVGDGGEVLDALQDLARLAATRETGERSRLMLDVAGYRAEKRRALERVGTEAAERVKQTGQPVRLEPMTPFERKVVHDAVAAAGLVSESEGEEPQRRVVVRPA
ncbi:MAG: R3H domain-containing nucleic acid-binding protein [Candidatus Nanopelagicales bacterium]